MGSVGDAYDNAMAESFFSTLECELLARRRFRSQAEARIACFSYIEGFYNPLRRPLGARLPFARRLRAGDQTRTINRTPAQPSPLTVHQTGAIPHHGTELLCVIPQ